MPAWYKVAWLGRKLELALPEILLESVVVYQRQAAALARQHLSATQIYCLGSLIDTQMAVHIAPSAFLIG